jgi:hypothetical protein
MQSTATIELHLPTLPPALKKATVFKEMANPLFAVPVLCDGDMEVTFRKTDMFVKDQNNNIVLQGKRDTTTPLWLIPIVRHKVCHVEQLKAMRNVKPSPSTAHSAYHQKHPSETHCIFTCMRQLGSANDMDKGHQKRLV